MDLGGNATGFSGRHRRYLRFEGVEQGLRGEIRDAEQRDEREECAAHVSLGCDPLDTSLTKS